MLNNRSPLIVFGVQPLATLATERLLDTNKYDLIGVVTRFTERDYTHHLLDQSPLAAWATENDVRILDDASLQSALDAYPDALGLSVRWGKIFSGELLSRFGRGIVNCHGGLLPRWRGSDVPSHLILEDAAEGGATLHLIDEKVDTGPIIDRQTFAVDSSDTAYDLYIKGQQALITLIERNASLLDQAHSTATPQQRFIDRGEQVGTYTRRMTENARTVEWPADFDTILRTARAFSFPGRPPAQISASHETVHISVDHQTEIPSPPHS